MNEDAAGSVEGSSEASENRAQRVKLALLAPLAFFAMWFVGLVPSPFNRLYALAAAIFCGSLLSLAWFRPSTFLERLIVLIVSTSVCLIVLDFVIRWMGPAEIYNNANGMFLQWWISKTEGKKIGSFLARINQKDLTCVKELLGSNEVKPVIDRRYPLSEAAEALRYLGEGHARGKIVLTLAEVAR